MWPPERLKVWQVLFLLFPLLAWLSWSSYKDFTRLETEGGVLYVHSLDKMLYDIGGKWAVVAFPVIIAGFWGYAVYKTLVLSKRAEELADPADADPPPPPAPAAVISKPPVARPRAASGPITPLAAAAPPPPVRAEDVPPDPSGPKLLR